MTVLHLSVPRPSQKLVMNKLLDERALWKILGTDTPIDSVRLSEESVKTMLRTGESPWGISGGSEIYWGKIVHRCRSDIKRCEEELPILEVEKSRCDMWAQRTMVAIEARLTDEGGPQGSGKGILLQRWKDLLMGIASQIGKLNW